MLKVILLTVIVKMKNKNWKIQNTKKCILNVCYVLLIFVVCCSTRKCLFLYGPFFIVPINFTSLKCLKHIFFEHLFNLYWKVNIIHILMKFNKILNVYSKGIKSHSDIEVNMECARLCWAWNPREIKNTSWGNIYTRLLLLIRRNIRQLVYKLD